ncbi:MAG: hypothetical protein ACYSSP_02615 [Planctomycetota bacterium]|jgi:hypothetical protein
MIVNERLYNVSYMNMGKSVYQTILSENNPLKNEEKGALEKFIDHIRDQAQTAQDTICYNKFFSILKQVLNESNKTKALKVLKKAEVITRYNAYLEHVQSQLDCLG